MNKDELEIERAALLSAEKSLHDQLVIMINEIQPGSDGCNPVVMGGFRHILGLRYKLYQEVMDTALKFFNAEVESATHRILESVGLSDCVFYNKLRADEFWVRMDGEKFRILTMDEFRGFLNYRGVSFGPSFTNSTMGDIDLVCMWMKHNPEAPLPPVAKHLLVKTCSNCIFFQDETGGERLHGLCTCPPPIAYHYNEYPFRQTKKEMTKAELELDEILGVHSMQPRVEGNGRCEKFHPLAVVVPGV